MSRCYLLQDHNSTSDPFLDILLPEIDQVLFPASQKISDKVKLYKEEKME
jgi:hypothetical protein